MWLNNPIVQDAVYRRLTGQSKHWLNWVLEEGLVPSHGKLLSIGCETGLHEVEIASMAPDLEIIAVEANPELAAVATQNAARFDNLTIVNSDVLSYVENSTEKFDALLSVNYLDREDSADKICTALRNTLKDSGTICVTEYVGPSYLDLAHKQEVVVDQFLSALDPQWKLSPNAVFRDSKLVESIKKSGRRKNPKSVVAALDKNFEMVVKRGALHRRQRVRGVNQNDR